jgi:hypothetical protein
VRQITAEEELLPVNILWRDERTTEEKEKKKRGEERRGEEREREQNQMKRSGTEWNQT